MVVKAVVPSGAATLVAASQEQKQPSVLTTTVSAGLLSAHTQNQNQNQKQEKVPTVIQKQETVPTVVQKQETVPTVVQKKETVVVHKQESAPTVVKVKSAPGSRVGSPAQQQQQPTDYRKVVVVDTRGVVRTMPSGSPEQSGKALGSPAQTASGGAVSSIKAAMITADSVVLSSVPSATAAVGGRRS